MTFLHQVDMRFIINGVEAFNIWHVADIAELQNFALIANVFRNDWWDNIRPEIHDAVSLQDITVKSLSAGATAPPFIEPVNELGDETTGEPYFSGNHYWLKLVSDDLGFKSGGKLVGGFGEVGVNGNLPVAALTAALNLGASALLLGLTSNGSPLAIFRPVLSLPGNPAFSLVASIITEWISTNNRRSPNLPAP